MINSLNKYIQINECNKVIIRLLNIIIAKVYRITTLIL